MICVACGHLFIEIEQCRELVVILVHCTVPEPAVLQLAPRFCPPTPRTQVAAPSSPWPPLSPQLQQRWRCSNDGLASGPSWASRTAGGADCSSIGRAEAHHLTSRRGSEGKAPAQRLKRASHPFTGIITSTAVLTAWCTPRQHSPAQDASLIIDSKVATGIDAILKAGTWDWIACALHTGSYPAPSTSKTHPWSLP